MENSTVAKNLKTSLKRSKTTLLEEKSMNCALKSKQTASKQTEFSKYENTISRNIQKNKSSWKKDEEQKLAELLLKNVVEEPYLEFGWQFYRQEKNLRKISKELNRNEFQCSQKMNQLKSVSQQKYSEHSFLGFLMAYWTEQTFYSQTGKNLIEQIRVLETTKSRHMEMCQKMTRKIDDNQKTLDSLFDFIMDE